MHCPLCQPQTLLCVCVRMLCTHLCVSVFRISSCKHGTLLSRAGTDSEKNGAYQAFEAAKS